MVRAILRGLYEWRRAPTHRLCRRKTGTGSTLRTPLLERAVVSRVQATKERSSRDSAPAKFESGVVRPVRYSRFDRDSRRNKRKRPRGCRKWRIRAMLFATRAPGFDKENRISL